MTQRRKLKVTKIKYYNYLKSKKDKHMNMMTRSGPNKRGEKIQIEGAKKKTKILRGKKSLGNMRSTQWDT
jgi:hypothetical protein